MTDTVTTHATPVVAAGLPTCSFDVLWHVGTLRAEDKTTWSYEGQGLSVSVHPDEWTRIARLAGPTWTLTRPGNTFLDYHALTADQRAEITAWGLAHRYVTESIVYRITLTDEDGDEQHMFFTDRADAVEEADFRTGEGDEAVVVEQAALLATGTFPDLTVPAGDIHPDQVLATVWIAAEHPDLDGVWWEDTYAPYALSCPRGVIIPARLPGWTITGPGTP